MRDILRYAKDKLGAVLLAVLVLSLFLALAAALYAGVDMTLSESVARLND